MKKLAIGLLVSAGMLTIAGCKQKEEGFGPGGTQINSGVGELYGCDPKESYKECHPGVEVEFKPKIYSVIYMRFGNLRSGKNQGFIARHAYFKTNGKTDNIKCAIQYLRKKNPKRHRNCPAIEPNKDNIDNHPLSKHRNLYQPTGNRTRKPYKEYRDDFDGMLFGSQQRVYVVIDNERIKFNDVIPMSFTPFGAYDFKKNKKPTRSQNSSMFEAKIDEITLGKKTLDILSYKNYYLDENGKPISGANKKNTTFSINYNLLICVLKGKNCKNIDPSTAQTGAIIPIAIDPDTGNGWGSKP